MAIVTVLGATLDDRTFPATTEGYGQLLPRARAFGALSRLEWSAPAPTVHRSPAPCAPKTSDGTPGETGQQTLPDTC
ncbi:MULTISPECIES: hypothetical protein [Streptomyces]|uniref:hypothetical protein n=1 Tax=Streptomyces lycopersici TaxID=2974589 RepID=UPI0021D178B9|nr:hypothetical protein [Streptomyces sp. NEAU-383]